MSERRNSEQLEAWAGLLAGSEVDSHHDLGSEGVPSSVSVRAHQDTFERDYQE